MEASNNWVKFTNLQTTDDYLKWWNRQINNLAKRFHDSWNTQDFSWAEDLKALCNEHEISEDATRAEVARKASHLI